MDRPIRVGVVGANPKRGWALNAHLPALAALDEFAIAAVCTTRQETADETAARFGVPKAYASWQAMLQDDAIDVVAVCVKVPHHREIASAAIEAGRHVFCEWPLGLTTGEAAAMAERAKARGVANMVGLQGRMHPVLNEVRKRIAGGEIGDVISASLISSLSSWGPRLPASEAYRTRVEGGATALTVAGGHSLDSLCHCLGGIRDVSAVLATQHKRVEIDGTGEIVEATTPDQLMLSATLDSGALLSVHVKADIANPTGVLFEVNGTEGDMVVTTRKPLGPAIVGIQRADLVLSVARGRKTAFVAAPVSPEFAIPVDLPVGPAFFTAALYKRLGQGLLDGGPLSPDFADAVRLHRLLDAVQAAADTGRRQEMPRDG